MAGSGTSHSGKLKLVEPTPSPCIPPCSKHWVSSDKELGYQVSICGNLELLPLI